MKKEKVSRKNWVKCKTLPGLALGLLAPALLTAMFPDRPPVSVPQGQYPGSLAGPAGDLAPCSSNTGLRGL